MSDIFHLPDSSDFLSLSSEFAQFTSTFFSPQPTSETDSPLESATDPDSLFTDTPLFSAATTTSTTSTTSETSTSTSVTTTPVSSLSSTTSQATTPSMTSSNTSAAASSTDSVIAANAEAATNSKSGASPAAVGVTVTLLLLVAIGAALFLYRRHQKNKRLARRQTWQMPVGSPKAQPMMYDEEKASSDGHAALMDNFESIDINEKRGPTPLPDEVRLQAVPVKLPTPPGALHAAGLAPPRLPSPPPMEMAGNGSSPVLIGYEAPSFGSGGQAPLITSTPFSATVSIPRSSATPSLNSAMNAQISHGTLVVVARTFVPSLPDELSIQTGEQVRIISKYDDGWAHVERLRSGAGENGVVPMDCLEAVSGGNAPVLPQIFSGPGLTQEAVESWRLSKRKSSLHPVGPAMY
ncbi:hypothetical protein FS837_011132 [Tulasnella sp. UAMH 9824]|nr:hypothetical protein FS837_011132 [Tulasnella sp. UAMH 9824]